MPTTEDNINIFFPFSNDRLCLTPWYSSGVPYDKVLPTTSRKYANLVGAWPLPVVPVYFILKMIDKKYGTDFLSLCKRIEIDKQSGLDDEVLQPSPIGKNVLLRRYYEELQNEVKKIFTNKNYSPVFDLGVIPCVNNLIKVFEEKSISIEDGVTEYISDTDNWYIKEAKLFRDGHSIVLFPENGSSAYLRIDTPTLVPVVTDGEPAHEIIDKKYKDRYGYNVILENLPTDPGQTTCQVEYFNYRGGSFWLTQPTMKFKITGRIRIKAVTPHYSSVIAADEEDNTLNRKLGDIKLQIVHVNTDITSTDDYKTYGESSAPIDVKKFTLISGDESIWEAGIEEIIENWVEMPWWVRAAEGSGGSQSGHDTLSAWNVNDPPNQYGATELRKQKLEFNNEENGEIIDVDTKYTKTDIHGYWFNPNANGYWKIISEAMFYNGVSPEVVQSFKEMRHSLKMVIAYDEEEFDEVEIVECNLKIEPYSELGGVQHNMCPFYSLPEMKCIDFIKGLLITEGSYLFKDALNNLKKEEFYNIITNLKNSKYYKFEPINNSVSISTPNELGQKNIFKSASDKDDQDEAREYTDEGYTNNLFICKLNNANLQEKAVLSTNPFYPAYIRNMSHPEIPTGNCVKIYSPENIVMFDGDKIAADYNAEVGKPTIWTLKTTEVYHNSCIYEEGTKYHRFVNSTLPTLRLDLKEIPSFRFCNNKNYKVLKAIFELGISVKFRCVLKPDVAINIHWTKPVYIEKMNSYFLISKYTWNCNTGVADVEAMKIPADILKTIEGNE